MVNDKLIKQLSDLNDCINWLKLIGVKHTSTRIHAYQKKLETYIKAVKEGKAQQLQESPEYLDYTKAFYEINELLEIYSGLKNVSINEELKKRISTYITGPYDITDEKPDQANRDIGFELFIGSRLLRSGYKVIFNNEGDLEYETEKNNFYLECKRPSSEKNLSANIDKAFKQLEKRYSKDPNGKGFITLSISKLLNKEHYTLGAPDVASLMNGLEQIVQQWLQEHLHLLPKQADKRTIGLIVLIQVPSYVQEGNNLSISTYTALVGFGSQGSEDFTLLQNIYQNLFRIL